MSTKTLIYVFSAEQHLIIYLLRLARVSLVLAQRSCEPKVKNAFQFSYKAFKYRTLNPIILSTNILDVGIYSILQH